MTRILLMMGLAAASSMALAAAPAAVAENAVSGKKTVSLKEARNTVRRVAAMNENGKVWRPGTVVNYSWGDNNWWENGKSNFEYDTYGRVSREILSGGTENVFTYADGQLVKTESYVEMDGELMLMSTQEFFYDSVVKDLVVRAVVTEEFGSYAQGVDITRNADGNITEVRNYYEYEGEKSDYGDVLRISYGADGKANAITEGYNYEGEFEVYDTYTDIEWENTNGQIYEIEIDDPDSNSYFGANRIKRAVVADSEWPRPAVLSVVYSGVNFVSDLDMDVEKLSKITYTQVDEYGSYDATHFEVDYDEEDGVYTIDFSRDRTSTYRVDAYGLELENMDDTLYHYEEGDEREIEGTKATVKYDDTYGYPLEYVQTYKSYESENFENRDRIVYSDYKEYESGVTAVEGNDGETVYYDLNGIRVANPTRGIYIKRQGDRVSKVIL